MLQETIRTKRRFHRDRKPGSSSLHKFDLPTIIEKMKQNQSWADGEPNITILQNNPKKQMVLTVFHEGTEINSFQANDSITFQILEGKIKFHTQYRSVILEQGHLLTLRDNIDYSLTIKEETVLLLTITNADLVASIN